MNCYITSVVLGYGVAGIYLGIALYYLSALGIVVVAFQYGDWVGRATALMDERGSVEAVED